MISRSADYFITCYTVLTRLNKVETAVHGCNSWLSVWTLSCCSVKRRALHHCFLHELRSQPWVDATSGKVFTRVASSRFIKRLIFSLADLLPHFRPCDHTSFQMFRWLHVYEWIMFRWRKERFPGHDLVPDLTVDDYLQLSERWRVSENQNTACLYNILVPFVVSRYCDICLARYRFFLVPEFDFACWYNGNGNINWNAETEHQQRALCKLQKKLKG